MAKLPKNIKTGDKFGLLTVIQQLESERDIRGCWHKVWECLCECGNKKILARANLMTIESCGCLRYNFYKSIKGKRAYNILPKGQRSINTINGNYKKRARNLNLTFSLTKEQFEELIFKNCYYCGIEPIGKINKGSIRNELIYNGIDRKNNNLGYIYDNCVTCCKICNHGKLNMEYEDWLSYLNKLVKYRIAL